jgi:CelD/BcsL family acetyltransferase involved in cellulose biosynthesis
VGVADTERTGVTTLDEREGTRGPTGGPRPEVGAAVTAPGPPRQVDGVEPRVRVTDRLGADAAAWDRLVERCALPSPFLRSWWLTAVAPPAGACFVLVHSGDALVGGLALERRRLPWLPALVHLGAGPLSPDHLDLLAAPGEEQQVIEALGRWLRRRGSRLVDVAGVAEGNRLHAVLGRRAVVTVEEAAPYVELSGDPDAHLATLPPIMRNSIRRSTRKLGRLGEVAFRIVEPADLDAALLRLRSLHAGQFGDDSGLIREWDRFCAAARAGHGAGELRLFELRVGDEVAAVDVAFTVAGRMSYYQGGRSLEERHSGAGTVLMANGFRWASSAGMSEVDFLRGTEPYKMQWATHTRRLLRLRLGVGPRGRAAMAAIRVREASATRAAGRRVRGAVQAVAAFVPGVGA